MAKHQNFQVLGPPIMPPEENKTKSKALTYTEMLENMNNVAKKPIESNLSDLSMTIAVLNHQKSAP